MLPADQRAPRFVVKISKQYIDAAKPGDASHCMIAEGLKAEYPDARWVLVDLQSIRFTDRQKGFRYVYMTPRQVQRNLLNFDHGSKPAPFSFLLTGGRVKTISKKPAKVASPKLRKAATKASKIQEARIKPKSAPLPDRPNVASSHKRQFGVRAL
jgi:hypothetical protein